MTFAPRDIPAELVQRMVGRPADTGYDVDGASWLAGLPRAVEVALQAWDLDLAGTAMSGHNALVVPVSRQGAPTALKLSWPHREAASEHIGLRHWNGNAAVELRAANPGQFALLLERLNSGADLTSQPIETACQVIGGLLGRLNVAPPPTAPEFRSVVADWIEPLRRRPAGVPRRWAERAVEVFDKHEFEARLLHLDLHFENVLSGDREPWLAIDPKPMAGPPGFEIYPALRNRTHEYGTGSTFSWQVRDRLEIVAGHAGIDIDEARAWSLVHAVLNAYEAQQDGAIAEVSFHLAAAKVVAEP